MSIAREQILERKQRLQKQREKDEAKLRELQQKLKQASQKIAEENKKEEAERTMILGNFILKKTKTDATFKTWLEDEIAASDLGKDEKSLLGFHQGSSLE